MRLLIVVSQFSRNTRVRVSPKVKSLIGAGNAGNAPSTGGISSATPLLYRKPTRLLPLKLWSILMLYLSRGLLAPPNELSGLPGLTLRKLLRGLGLSLPDGSPSVGCTPAASLATLEATVLNL